MAVNHIVHVFVHYNIATIIFTYHYYYIYIYVVPVTKQRMNYPCCSNCGREHRAAGL